jgi:hypothetical protein
MVRIVWQLSFFNTELFQNHSILMHGQVILQLLKTTVFLSFCKTTDMFGNCLVAAVLTGNYVAWMVTLTDSHVPCCCRYACITLSASIDTL